jgi:PAS domain-containing protein
MERLRKAVEATDRPLKRQSERFTTKTAALPIRAAALAAAFDNLHQGFMLLDDQWRVTDFNSRLNDIVGYPAGVLHVGANPRDLIRASVALGHHPGRSVEEIYEQWRQRLADRTPGDHLGHTPEGRTIKIGYAPFDEGAWAISYEDISGRLDAEKALAEQNERFDAALTNIPHGVCMFDADKRLILCNAGYASPSICHRCSSRGMRSLKPWPTVIAHAFIEDAVIRSLVVGRAAPG